MQQSENFGPVFFGQAKSATLIVEGIAGRAAVQRSSRPVVEVVDDRFDLSPQVGANGKMWEQALVELALDISDAFFDGAVIGRAARRAVEREHTVALQNLVDGFMVEGAAVVPFQAKP